MGDVTENPGIAPNYRGVTGGTYGNQRITMEQVTAAADSFNYEFVCGISRRVPRICISGGKTVHAVHYLIGSYKEDI